MNVTPPRELFMHFYFDCQTHDPQAAKYLIDQVGAEHVVIGADHPFDMTSLMARQQRFLNSNEN